MQYIYTSYRYRQNALFVSDINIQIDILNLQENKEVEKETHNTYKKESVEKALSIYIVFLFDCKFK